MKMSYYSGNLHTDFAALRDAIYVERLDVICSEIGYGRCQQLLQQLWIKKLEDAQVLFMSQTEIEANDRDLGVVRSIRVFQSLECLGDAVGYRRCQSAVQVLWARHLDGKGIAPIGALCPYPLIPD